MFQGSSALNMDVKGRLSIPARHRDDLIEQCQGELTLTRHPHGCVLLFPRSVWDTHREKIAAWPMSARAWQRIFLGNATDVEMDTAGRILIPPKLRQDAHLSREVVLLGMGSHLEIWDAARLAEDEAAAMAGGLPEMIQDFSF